MNTGLVPIAPDLWSVEQQVRLPGGAILPARMTVIRLPTGGLVLHSPVTLDEDVIAALRALGVVQHLVAPCLIHHLFLADAHRRFPAAQIHVPPGFTSAPRSLTDTALILGNEAPPAWAGVLDQQLLGGAPKLNEVDFYHRPTRTLIAPDLVFNIQQPGNFMTGLVLRLMGTHKRLAMSRLWRRYTRDRAALRRSLDHVLSWDFIRVVPGHGEVATDNAHDAVEAALAWMRKP